MMPEMDGFEFLERIRERSETLADLPVVVLTAKELTESERNFLAERTAPGPEQERRSRSPASARRWPPLPRAAGRPSSSRPDVQLKLMP